MNFTHRKKYTYFVKDLRTDQIIEKLVFNKDEILNKIYNAARNIPFYISSGVWSNDFQKQKGTMDAVSIGVKNMT